MMENKKVIRHLDAPRTFGEWLHRYRFTIARRFVQFCILLAFIGTFRFGWKVLGHPYPYLPLIYQSQSSSLILRKLFIFHGTLCPLYLPARHQTSLIHHILCIFPRSFLSGFCDQFRKRCKCISHLLPFCQKFI